MGFMLFREPEDMPYASQLDCMVSSQEYPYTGHRYSDYGFDKIEKQINQIERKNNREPGKHKYDV